MTEIKAEEATVAGTAVAGCVTLGDFIIIGRELENLYAYLEGKRPEREQELMEVSRKAEGLEESRASLSSYYRRMEERLEARNNDLDRLAGILEKV